MRFKVKTMLYVLYTRLGEKVKLQKDVAGVMVTSEFTPLGTATSAPMVPVKLEVLPAGKGLSTFPTSRVKVASMVPLLKMLVRVIWLLS